MTSDYKWKAQMFAEDLAAQEYGEDKDFFTLPEEKRAEFYNAGMEIVVEKMTARAEWEADRRRERAR